MSEPEERGSPEWCTWAHKRIALLESVAEASERKEKYSDNPADRSGASWYILNKNVRTALRAAGYLREKSDE
jgi:hypothetical protein